MGMADPQLYYWASQICVINDWVAGGWQDPAFRLEVSILGLDGVLNILYGAPIPSSCVAGARAVFLAWRAALRRTGWNRKLTRETLLWRGTWL